MLIRGPDLRAGMSEYLAARIEANPAVEVRPGTEVLAAEGDGRLERLVLGDTRTGARDSDTGSARKRRETVPASRLFVFIGASPPTEFLGESFLRDKRGFLRTGPALLDGDGRPPASWPLTRDPYHLESSVPGVFVAGDVRAESVKRVASAVGEGAMAVTLIHRYLESI
jgi:thioredoxin reductase (NADPH)